MSDLPERRIDRAALERIIQRAAELQTGERDIGDGLTRDEVLALAKDVGIPEAHVRRAMLEEQTRLTTQANRGVLDRAIGPGVLEAARVVPGDVAAVEKKLLAWMDKHELLAVQRQQPGRISWEPLGGMPAAIRRGTAALGSGSKPFMLAKAERVHATVMALEPGYCHVSLRAEMPGTRTGYVVGAGALGFAGVAATAILATLGAFLPVVFAPLPIAAAAGWGALRAYRPVVERTQIGLERALDHLEQSRPELATPASPGANLLGAVLTEVRKALQ